MVHSLIVPQDACAQPSPALNRRGCGTLESVDLWHLSRLFAQRAGGGDTRQGSDRDANLRIPLHGLRPPVRAPVPARRERVRPGLSFMRADGAQAMPIHLLRPFRRGRRGVNQCRRQELCADVSCHELLDLQVAGDKERGTETPAMQEDLMRVPASSGARLSCPATDPNHVGGRSAHCSALSAGCLCC